MVVSCLPWTTKETVYKLSELSIEKPFGYVSMMNSIFINNWPSLDLTHFFHIILCSGQNSFQMHTAMGVFGGFPKAKRDFIVWPLDLLNDEERQMIGI